MRLVDVLRLIAPLVGVCVAALMVVRRKLVRHCESRAAFGPESATSPPATLRAPMRWWRKRLLASGELRALDDGREWLDRERSSSSRRLRRRRALTVASVLVVLLLLVAWFGATR